jgi:hypothetical protein
MTNTAWRKVSPQIRFVSPMYKNNTTTHREPNHVQMAEPLLLLCRNFRHFIQLLTRQIVSNTSVILDSEHIHSFYTNKSLCKAINSLGMPRAFLSTVNTTGLTTCQRKGILWGKSILARNKLSSTPGSPPSNHHHTQTTTTTIIIKTIKCYNIFKVLC